MGLFNFFIKGVSISLLVKLSGLIRDALTFYFIGISGLFDTYVYYLTFPAIITAFILPLINLWLVPVLTNSEKENNEVYFNFFFLLSLFLALFNIFISFTITLFFKEAEINTLILIFTATIVLIFTVCSEVLASKIISSGKYLHKMYFGNLFVNAPVIIYLIFPEPTVIGLSIVSSLSFVARFTYLFVYSEVSFERIIKSNDMSSVLKEINGIELKELKKMLLGPIFQSTVYLGRFFCGFLPTGAVSIYFYSFKLFDAFKGTLLFVGLTKFFSVIQKESLNKALKTFTSFSCINLCVSISYILLLTLLSYILNFVSYEQIGLAELKKIIDLSFVTAPLCFLYPSIVFYQRLVVSFRDMYFSFFIFMLLPFFVIIGVAFTYLINQLSVTIIISMISVALIAPNLYIFSVVLKKQKSLRCKNVL